MTVALDLLLVAAFHPEVAGLRATLGDSLQGRVGGLSVAAKVIGIGLPAAVFLAFTCKLGALGLWLGLTAGLVTVAAALATRFATLSRGPVRALP